jgi:REP element-mobilizing transposase RayT
MIISNSEGTRISDIIRDFKRMTSRMIIEELKKDGKTKILSHLSFRARIHYKHHKFKVWQDGNHAIELYTPKFTWVRVRYIHNNPVTAGLVDCTTDWKWSSARNYYDMEAVFDDVYCLSAPVNFEN